MEPAAPWQWLRFLVSSMTTGVAHESLRIVIRNRPLGLTTSENRKVTWTRPVRATWIRNARDVPAPLGRVKLVSELAAKRRHRKGHRRRDNGQHDQSSHLSRSFVRDENGCRYPR